MSSGFSNDGEIAINRQLSSNLKIGWGFAETHPQESRFEENYEIARIVSWIHELNATKVALQFPDELLVDAPDVVAHILKSHPLNVELFVLGDTSYGSCCVDEMSALHVGANALVHFGPTCLSQNQRLPVLFIHENVPVESGAFLTAYQSVLLPTLHSGQCLIVASDLRYHQATAKLIPEMAQFNLAVTYLEPNLQGHSFAGCSNGADTDVSELALLGRRCRFPPNGSGGEEAFVLFIGGEGTALTNLMLALNQYIFYTYNPETCVLRKETLDVNQQLRKRYFLIEKAKDAQLIGILVATLGVKDYLLIIERIKRLITSAGKKYYTFVVGKLNPSKLANFPEIDCFTIIACPENSLLNSKDFYRPIVTPFELEVALNSARPWTGSYLTDFRQLLPGGTGHVEFDVQAKSMDVSLVSGRARNLGIEREEAPCNQLPSEERSIKNVSAQELNVLPSGSDFLRQRAWHGLEPRIGETVVPSTAVAGRHGLAASYQEEGLGGVGLNERRKESLSDHLPTA